MKNIKKRLIGWTLGLALSLGVGIGIASNTHSEITGVEAAGETTVATLTFPDENKANNKVGAYTKTWTAKIGTNSWSIKNFNNNNWGWKLIKCGRKDVASVASITNTTALANVSRINVSIPSVTAANVNSFYLECGKTATTINENKKVFTIKSGDNALDVGSNEYSFFKLTFDCKGGSGNGFVQIDSIIYNEVDDTVHSVLVSGPKAVEKGKTVQLEASCSKDDAITWACTPENVATVSSTGLVTGVSEGEATVTATCDGSGTETYKVKVFEIVKGKTISEVTNLPADATKLYEINGTVSQWYTNKGNLNTNASQYGNYYLKDSSVSEGDGLLIYGATATANSLSYDGTEFVFNNPKDYLDNELTKDTKIGSNVVMYGFRLDYGSTKEFNGIVTSVTNPASDFAAYFLDALSGACDASGNSNMETLKLGWATVALEFAKLSNVDKDVYAKGTGNSTGNNIEKAIALYDYIATKYGTSLESEDCTNYNFMNRSVTPVAGSKTILDSNGNVSATALVTVVALASLTAAGSFFFIRKRKEQN